MENILILQWSLVKEIWWCKHLNFPPQLFVCFQKVTGSAPMLSMDKPFALVGYHGFLLGFFLFLLVFFILWVFWVFLGACGWWWLILFVCLFCFFPNMCFNPIKGITVFHLTLAFISLEGKFKHEYLGILQDGMYQYIIERD